MAEWDQIIGPIKADLAAVPPRVTDDIELRRMSRTESTPHLTASPTDLSKAREIYKPAVARWPTTRSPTI